jgi:nitroreductase
MAPGLRAAFGRGAPEVIDMLPIQPQTLITALHWRYATKVFDATRRISDEDWKHLEESLILTPTSFGLQPYRFIIVTDPELKARLRTASWGQSQITDCSHLVVFVAKQNLTVADIDHYIERIAEVRGTRPEDLAGYHGMMVNTLVTGARAASVPEWAARQCYIALGQFMASAAMLGLDTCPMEGLDPLQYDQILGLDGSAYHTVVACPVGYRAGEDKYASMAKVRFPSEELVEWR